MEDNTFINVSKDMMSFIEKSPSVFHVTANFMDLLDDAGFVRLNEMDRWHLISGGKYYVTTVSYTHLTLPTNSRV